MQLAHCWVALGGDTGNTVPKFDVTPAEIAVLQAIHGSDAVFDIVPVNDTNRSNREERSRLLAFYGKPAGSREVSAVDALFPGMSARLPETFEELELDESFFKATERATASSGPTSKVSAGTSVNQVDVDAEEGDEATDKAQAKAATETAKLEKKTGKASAVDKRPAGGKAKRQNPAAGDPAKVIEPVAHSHRDEAALEDDPAAKAKQPKTDPVLNTVTHDEDDGIGDMPDKGIFK